MNSDDELDRRRERAARNESLFRQVNERIDELAQKFQLREETLSCVCECADPMCVERIEISHHEYERVRKHPEEFIIRPGHEVSQVEEVVHRETRWIVVRKVGVAATVAAELQESADGD